MDENDCRDGECRFGRDFFTGCLAMVLIFVTIFILVPVALFVLRLSLALVIPVAALVLLVIITAFFGRVINDLIRRRRE